MSEPTEGPAGPGGEPPTAPPPPPPPPAAPGAVTLTSESMVRSGGIGARMAAGVLGLGLLIGGVAFAATQVGGDAGAGDPEAAVRDMFDAISDEDVLGLLATLDPGERDVISRPVEQLFDELERLEVLDDSFRLDGIDGIDLEFEDLAFRTEPVRDDLVRVYLTGGTASYAVDTDEIPVGDFLVDTFDRFGVEYEGIQESDSDALDPDQVGETFVVVRDTGDGWNVSLGYTAVEVARERAGAQVPVAGAGLTAIGAASPEAAVEGLLQAAVAIDIEGVVARLSPDELRAVHDYWPALVDDADLPTSDDVEAEIELADLELRSTTDGDRGQVFIDSIGVDVVTEDFSGGGTIARGCIEVRGDVRERMEEEDIDLPDGPICQDDIEDILEDATGDIGVSPFGFGGLGGLTRLGPDDVDAPTLGITVVRVDGAWFVAPLGTFADVGLAMLETLEREDLDAMVDAVEEFLGGFETSFGGGFDDVEGFEDVEDLEGQFDDFDDELEAAGDVDAVLEEMLAGSMVDAATAQCMLAELRATATTEQLAELADAYLYEYEPLPETQDVFFAAMQACGG